MKKILAVCALLAVMVANMPSVSAQLSYDTMPVPMGNFEEWNYLPGDTVTLMILPIPINNGMSVPAGWSVPHYVFDDTLSYMGFNLPINADIPVAKVWEDTAHAPQGAKGVVAESFIFSDILTPTVYSLASSLLDSSLVGTILPSIVATGEVKLNNIIPMVTQMMNNTEDYDWMLPLVDSVDINEFVTGGFPLNGFKPTMLKGMYKYATSNDLDYGAVLAVGTRYDTMQHRRMLVGAGSKMLHMLPDTIDYEPFEMDYSILSDYYPAGYEYTDADTMIVFIVSSASNKMRVRGSRLYVDSLFLMQELDTCGRVYNITTEDIYYTNARVKWSCTVTPDHYDIEYGESGFVLGTGDTRTVSDTSVFLINLTPGTVYDCYVRPICDGADGSWVYVTFSTDSVPDNPPQGIQEVSQNLVRIYPNPAHGTCRIDASEIAVSHVRLYTIDGRILQDAPFLGNQCTITLPQPGIYFVELQTEQGPIYRKLCSE